MVRKFNHALLTPYGVRRILWGTPSAAGPRPLLIFQDCGFLAFLQTDLRLLVPEHVIWHAWCLQLGVLRDLGTILGHWGAQERALWSPGLDFEWFLVHLGTPLLRANKNMYFVMLVSRLLFLIIVGFKFGCLGLDNQAFGMDSIDFSWFQGPFFMILNVFGTNFHDLCCPGDWLDIW